MTRYGCTSTVSLSDVMDLAGSNFGFGFECLAVRNLAIILSICARISGGVAADCFL
jgi:hypothetical protein